MSARERARLARLRVDEERMRRDAAIESAMTRYFESEGRRDALLDQVAETERAMSRDVQALVDLKESRSRIAAMLDLDTREVGRLLRLDLAETNGEPAETTAVSNSGDEDSPESPERDSVSSLSGRD